MNTHMHFHFHDITVHTLITFINVTRYEKIDFSDCFSENELQVLT